MLLEFALLGALFIRLHQPVLIACIVVGPTGVVEVHDQIDLLSGQVAGAVRDVRHGHALQAAGVQYILNPFDDVADPAAQRLAGYIHSSREDKS
ncbi:MAG: hypothetical protein ABI642_10145 [Polaromonas sp.]